MASANNAVAVPTCERYECPSAVYHADTDSISNSMLGTLIDSPELYYGMYVARTITEERSSELDLGDVTHDAILCGGGFSAHCMEIPASALNKDGHKKGKPWDDFKAEHKRYVLLKPKEFASVRLMYDGIMANEKARMILESEGPVESCWKWNCTLTGMSRRARLDKFAERRMIVGDLKTTADITPRGFIGGVAKWRYHVQNVYYQDAIHAETGECPQFVFIAVEKKQPFRCRCFDLDDVFIQRGEQLKNEKLLELSDRKRTGCWTAPDSNLIVTLGAPYWLGNLDQWNLNGVEAE